MKKTLAILLATFLGAALWAQEADSVGKGFITPNFKFVYGATTDTASPYYYPKLVQRFAEADTDLTIFELQAFYFGQAYQPNYSPYLAGQDEFQAIHSIMSKEEEPTRADFDSIVYYADQVIAEHPAEPMAYYYKFIGLNAIYQNYGGDTTARTQAQRQFEMLFYTIESTGNGLTTSQPFYVVSTRHEYMMLNMYGFEPKGQALIHEGEHSFDLLYLQENEYGVDSLYFNIDLLMSSLSQMFDSHLDFDPEEKVSSLNLPIGTKFVIEMVKTKRKESTFRILSMEVISDTLNTRDSSLFPNPIPENRVVGYFAPARLSSNSDAVFNCLLFKSNISKDMLFMDTYIRYIGALKFEPTSNSGLMRGVLMNEMWDTSIKQIRISNIRTKE